ncbi:hypothetical protein C440_16976 [Haloferax mucosum ATCC BAA-1512]|uniref:CAAX prenyl protease 2/Lysostaphin resistance protein A-like domain-containing protein n=1 Tax=Haloferax mucosum ATCC BAA-1512 TaxID=662479 RepID=M0I375_9EURY|nr:CPBP family intramembrane glutamic endopeptidase [Haloferax mucosum]ELZ90392.1 hypothetical protein C440_16976 [Haloferax mucosum ATCC BAA-1512]
MSITTRVPDPIRSLGVAIGLGGAGLLFGILLVDATGRAVTSTGLQLSPLLLLVVSLVLMQGVAFGGVTLVYAKYRGFGPDHFGISIPSLRDLVAIIFGYVTAFGAILVIGNIIRVLGIQGAPNQVAEISAQNPEVLLFLIPASFLIIGPGEELLFRGVVQNRLRESFGPVSGILLASAFFAAIHFAALAGGTGARLVTISVLFVPSLIFGIAYELTDNLVVPSLIHGAYNATLFSLLYVLLKFAELNPDALPSGVLF